MKISPVFSVCAVFAGLWSCDAKLSTPRSLVGMQNVGMLNDQKIQKAKAELKLDECESFMADVEKKFVSEVQKLLIHSDETIEHYMCNPIHRTQILEKRSEMKEDIAKTNGDSCKKAIETILVYRKEDAFSVSAGECREKIQKALGVLRPLLHQERRGLLSGFIGTPDWEPTPNPSSRPSSRPSSGPSSTPSSSPSRSPSPSSTPSRMPSKKPTPGPTEKPTPMPVADNDVDVGEGLTWAAVGGAVVGGIGDGIKYAVDFLEYFMTKVV